MNLLYRLSKYLAYQHKARTKYYLHSPFVYQFYLNVLEDNPEQALQPLEELRSFYRRSAETLEIEDLGTGTPSVRRIADIEKKVAIRPKYGRLLYRLVKQYKPATILELGTSLGISASYMAAASPAAKVITLEGAPQLAPVAKDTFTGAEVHNVQLITGNFNNTLLGAIQSIKPPGLVFFDGNHRKEATLQYFNQCLPYINEQTIFVFDDIYWSAEMAEAWETIKQHPDITLTIDVFQLGICFFTKGKMKEDFMLRY